MQGRLDAMENHFAASDYLRRVRPLHYVAIVDLPEHQVNNQLFEDTAVNRGAAVRFFTAIADAAQWLQQHPPHAVT